MIPLVAPLDWDMAGCCVPERSLRAGGAAAGGARPREGTSRAWDTAAGALQADAVLAGWSKPLSPAAAAPLTCTCGCGP
jgi:hypothetical protein